MWVSWADFVQTFLFFALETDWCNFNAFIIPWDVNLDFHPREEIQEKIFFQTKVAYQAKRNHTKRLLSKIYYSPQSKVSIFLRLVQNACRNWAIALGVTQRGPKYAKEP